MTLTLERTKPRQRIDTANLVIAVCGPPGSTGRTSLALNLAYEFAELGRRTILIDLDTWAPSIVTLLGVTNPTAGLTGAARLIRQSRFDREQLDRLSLQVRHRKASFHCLTGLSSPKRWGEVTEDTVSQLLNLCRFEFEIVIIDLSSEIEANLTAPSQPSQRNSATRFALTKCDLALTVINPSELSLSRYLQGFAELQELQANRPVILNRAEPKANIASALKTLTKESIFATIPDDPIAFELAESAHLPVALARRKSPARNAIAALAHKLLECPPSAS